MGLIQGVLAASLGILILMLVIIIALYIFLAIFLNKYHYLKYEKKTALAWIPVLQIYILGKLVGGKVAAWLLFIFVIVCSILTGQSTTTVTINGEVTETTSSILSGTAATIVNVIQSVTILIFIIVAIVKYFKLKKSEY